jgi:hypothetical protein
MEMLSRLSPIALEEARVQAERPKTISVSLDEKKKV